MIIRLAVRVIRGAHAEDDRSDDEDGFDDDEEETEDVDDDATVVSLSVSTGIGGIPDKISTEPTSITTVNGTIAFSNGIHQRKTEKGE